MAEQTGNTGTGQLRILENLLSRKKNREGGKKGKSREGRKTKYVTFA